MHKIVCNETILIASAKSECRNGNIAMVLRAAQYAAII